MNRRPSRVTLASGATVTTSSLSRPNQLNGFSLVPQALSVSVTANTTRRGLVVRFTVFHPMLWPIAWRLVSEVAHRLEFEKPNVVDALDRRAIPPDLIV